MAEFPPPDDSRLREHWERSRSQRQCVSCVTERAKSARHLSVAGFTPPTSTGEAAAATAIALSGRGPILLAAHVTGGTAARKTDAALPRGEKQTPRSHEDLRCPRIPATVGNAAACTDNLANARSNGLPPNPAPTTPPDEQSGRPNSGQHDRASPRSLRRVIAVSLRLRVVPVSLLLRRLRLGCLPRWRRRRLLWRRLRGS